MFSLLYPFLLALLSRLHGSSIKTPKVLDSLLYALPYAFFAHDMGWKFYIPILLLTAMCKSMPHEAFFGLPGNQRLTYLTGIVDILSPNKDRLSGTWLVVGWVVKGFAIHASLATTLILYGDPHGLLVLVCGTLSSAIAYPLCKRLALPLMPWTAWAELLTGFICGLGFL